MTALLQMLHLCFHLPSANPRGWLWSYWGGCSPETCSCLWEVLQLWHTTQVALPEHASWWNFIMISQFSICKVIRLSNVMLWVMQCLTNKHKGQMSFLVSSRLHLFSSLLALTIMSTTLPSSCAEWFAALLSIATRCHPDFSCFFQQSCTLHPIVHRSCPTVLYLVKRVMISCASALPSSM